MMLPRLYLGAAALAAAREYVETILGPEVSGHPDLFPVTPQGTTIGIAQIREAVAWARYAPVRAPKRVILIGPAEKLSEEAASALLKSLEEAPAYLEFVLYGEAPDRLIPTVRSRCAAVWAPFTRQLAANKLAQAGYSQEEREFLLGFIESVADLSAVLESRPSPKEAWESARREAEGAAFSELGEKFVAQLGDPIRRRALARALVSQLPAQPADRILEVADALARGGREALLLFSRELAYLLASGGLPVPRELGKSWGRKASLARGELEDNANVKLLAEVILLWPKKG